MPFAVVGSDKEYQVNGKRVLGRKTPWGIIEGKKVHPFMYLPRLAKCYPKVLIYFPALPLVPTLPWVF